MKIAKESQDYFEKVKKVKVGEQLFEEGVLKGTHMGNGWLSGPWQCNKCMKMVPADHSGCPWCAGIFKSERGEQG